MPHFPVIDTSCCFRAMASDSSKQEMLKQMERIVEGVKQTRAKVRVYSHDVRRQSALTYAYATLNALVQGPGSDTSLRCMLFTVSTAGAEATGGEGST